MDKKELKRFETDKAAGRIKEKKITKKKTKKEKKESHVN